MTEAAAIARLPRPFKAPLSVLRLAELGISPALIRLEAAASIPFGRIASIRALMSTFTPHIP